MIILMLIQKNLSIYGTRTRFLKIELQREEHLDNDFENFLQKRQKFDLKHFDYRFIKQSGMIFT